jgi:hypothetical protein
MSYNEENMGPSPEQLAGVAAAAAVGLTALTIGVIRRRRRRKRTLAARAEEFRRNPSLQKALASAREAIEQVDGRRLDEARRELLKQAESLPKSLRSDVEPLAREMAVRARDIAERMREEGGARSKELSKKWQKEYGPAARSWAEEAVHEAEHILETARDRATDLGDTARKDYLPKVAPLAAAATGAIATALTEGAERLSEQFKEGQTRVSKDLKKRKGLRKQPNVVKRTGSAVADATGQAIMIGFWGAALGAVVYYGLLNEERRERVRAFFNDTFAQISDLVGDFRDEAMDVAQEADRF